MDPRRKSATSVKRICSAQQPRKPEDAIRGPARLILSTHFLVVKVLHLL
jgi:hypothetical protein